MNNEERRKAWQLYYLTAMGWMLHPGHKHSLEHVETVLAERCATLATRMLRETEAQWGLSGEQ